MISQVLTVNQLWHWNSFEINSISESYAISSFNGQPFQANPDVFVLYGVNHICSLWVGIEVDWNISRMFSILSNMENIPDQLIYSTYGNPQFSQLVYGIISPPMETNKCTFRIGKRPFGNHMWSATCKDKPWSNFLNWWFPGISGMAKVWKVWKVAPTQKESTMHYRIHQIRTCPKMQHHCVFWSVENLQKQHDIHTPFNLIIGTSRFAATFLLVHTSSLCMTSS